MAALFPYAQRAREAEAARLRLHDASAALRRNGGETCRRNAKTARDEFQQRLIAAFPENFWDEIEKLRAGDHAYADTAIDFLLADPMFFRSGYVKEDLIRYLGQVSLSEAQLARLRSVVLQAVWAPHRREFRRYCRLARRVHDPTLRAALERIEAGGDLLISRHARWVLEAITERKTPARS